MDAGARGFVSARPARAPRGQRVGRREDRGHRPKDLPPAHQQVSDPGLTTATRQPCPTEAVGPHAAPERAEVNVLISLCFRPGIRVAESILRTTAPEEDI